MSELSKIETYIDISKLIDMGEDELADKMLRIVSDSTYSRSCFHYIPTFVLKETRDVSTTINRIKKSIKRA